MESYDNRCKTNLNDSMEKAVNVAAQDHEPLLLLFAMKSKFSNEIFHYVTLMFVSI